VLCATAACLIRPVQLSLRRLGAHALLKQLGEIVPPVTRPSTRQLALDTYASRSRASVRAVGPLIDDPRTGLLSMTRLKAFLLLLQRLQASARGRAAASAVESCVQASTPCESPFGTCRLAQFKGQLLCHIGWLLLELPNYRVAGPSVRCLMSPLTQCRPASRPLATRTAPLSIPGYGLTARRNEVQVTLLPG
jgi:hypothetical protein